MDLQNDRILRNIRATGQIVSDLLPTLPTSESQFETRRVLGQVRENVISILHRFRSHSGLFTLQPMPHGDQWPNKDDLESLHALVPQVHLGSAANRTNAADLCDCKYLLLHAEWLS